MRVLRFFLFPLSAIYWAITFVRNKCFDWNIIQSNVIVGKSISVGNLSMGGTGKSPHLNYLIHLLLSERKKITTLSRGYGRKTKGLLIANENSTSDEIGDEPLMYRSIHGNSINVVVDENRWEGIQTILQNFPQNEIILLDDAYQHRKVKAGLNILITEYDRPYFKDWIVPVGRLREARSGVKRADVVIVSKCPNNISEKDKKRFIEAITLPEDQIFFSTIAYDALRPVTTDQSDVENVLIVTGIGNPKPLLNHLASKYQVEHVSFPDHHEFTQADIDKIHKKFDTFASRNKIVVTTEKDFMRLKKFEAVYNENIPWFVQPINSKIQDENRFNTLIINYVNKV
jgi:tetraacyldisaccharide 4'-kinase